MLLQARALRVLDAAQRLRVDAPVAAPAGRAVQLARARAVGRRARAQRLRRPALGGLRLVNIQVHRDAIGEARDLAPVLPARRERQRRDSQQPR